MLRLIDADTLHNAIEGYCQGCNRGEGSRCGACDIRIALDCIEDAPTVEATVFPCKIGDPVWFVGTSTTNRLNLGVIETTVEKLILKKGGIYMKLACNAMYETSCKSIGKTVFFTQEAAEAALAWKQGGTVR